MGMRIYNPNNMCEADLTGKPGKPPRSTSKPAAAKAPKAAEDARADGVGANRLLPVSLRQQHPCLPAGRYWQIQRGESGGGQKPLLVGATGNSDYFDLPANGVAAACIAALVVNGDAFTTSAAVVAEAKSRLSTGRKWSRSKSPSGTPTMMLSSRGSSRPLRRRRTLQSTRTRDGDRQRLELPDLRDRVEYENCRED